MRPGDLDTDEPIVTVDDIAARAGISPRTVHAYVARGRAPAPDGHVGRTPVWRESSAAAWVASRTGSDRVLLSEAAELAGVPYRRLLQLVDDGALEATNDGGTVTVSRSDLGRLPA